MPAASMHHVHVLALRRAISHEFADRCQRRAAEYDLSRTVERYDELYRRLTEKNNNRSGK